MSANFANSILSPLQGGSMAMKNALDFTFGYQSAAAVAAAASAVTSPQHGQQLHAADMGAFDQLFAASSAAAGFGSGVSMGGGDLYGSRLSHGFPVDPTSALLGSTGHHYRSSNGVTSAVTSSHPFASSSSIASSASSPYDVMNGNSVYDISTAVASSRQQQQLKSTSSSSGWLTSPGQCHQQQQAQTPVQQTQQHD